MSKVTGHMKRAGGLKDRVVCVILSRTDRKAYVGLTYQLKRRIAGHLESGKPYVKAILSGPHKIVKSRRIPEHEAARLEARTIEKLRKRGWDVVNPVKGGGLGGMRRKWTKAMVQNEALRFNTKMEFKAGNHGAYAAAQKHSWLRAVCAHMADQRGKDKLIWTDEAIAAEAYRYSARKAFFDGSKGAYCAAQAKGLLDQVCAHMTDARDGNPGPRKWSDERVEAVAAECGSRSELKRKHPGAYHVAWKRGLLDRLFPKD